VKAAGEGDDARTTGGGAGNFHGILNSFGAGGDERMALMADMIAGTEGARVPGRRRQQIRADYLENGIPVDADLAASIRAIGA